MSPPSRMLRSTPIVTSRQECKDNSNPFRFLDLPPELRNRVYEYFLTIPTDDDVDKITLMRYPWAWDLYPRNPVLGLLRTRRQVHDEAEGIYYALNQLSVDTRLLSPFGLSLNHTRVGAIKSSVVRVSLVMSGVHDLLHKLQCLTGLKSLHIRLDTQFAN